MIGNDIVDLHFMDSPAYQHVRYLDRVCTSAEVKCIRHSEDASTSLAIVWASKEAAYKAYAKQLIGCCFVPRQFVTDFEKTSELNSKGNLTVNYAGTQTRVEILVTKRWVHAIATSSEDTHVRGTVLEIEQCFQGGHKARGESEAVRFLASGLLSKFGCVDMALEFSRRIPTVLLNGGGPSGIDISLSHHGAFAAAAIALPSDKALPCTQNHGRSHAYSDSEGLCSTYMA
ncbi:MAG: hypothetical protein PVS2B2_23530 [Candidatus Acidiferrum sp.]